MRSRQEERFIACSAKTCCETDTVYLSAGDLTRISDMLEVVPEAFTATEPAAPDDPEAFALADGPVRLRLAHRETGGCVFLLRLPDGAGRCALDDNRPLPCRAPVGSPSCTCGAWPAADVDGALRDADRALREAHMAVAARWNRRDHPGGLDELYEFLWEPEE